MTAAVLVAAAVAVSSCRSVLSVEYEYDEDIYLNLDGSATVYVNASVPALVALRGADLDIDPRARLDRNDVRAFYESPLTEVESVTSSRRNNRRYVHVRMDVPDIRQLGSADAFAWAKYSMTVDAERALYRQEIGPSAGAKVGDVGWTGQEKVAIRLHLPSRVPFHNSPSSVERGNIIRWEQPLAERLAGQPLVVEAQMEPESILFETLTLFGMTALAALMTMALAIWWVMRRKGADV